MLLKLALAAALAPDNRGALGTVGRWRHASTARRTWSPSACGGRWPSRGSSRWPPRASSDWCPRTSSSRSSGGRGPSSPVYGCSCAHVPLHACL